MAQPIWTGANSDSASTAGNFSTGSAPANGDTEWLIGGVTVSNDILTNLNQSAVALAKLNVDQGFVNLVGTSSAYYQIGATTVNLGLPQPNGELGNGSGRLNLDLGASSVTVNVFNSAGTGNDTGQAPIRLLGSDLTVNLNNGIISVAALPSESATVTALNVDDGGGSVPPRAYIGPGATMTALVQTAGAVVSASTSAVTSAKVSRQGTEFIHIGTGGFTALQIDPLATVRYNGSGAVPTIDLFGTLDLSGGGAAVAFGGTAMRIYKGAVIKDPLGRGTYSNVTLVGCNESEITVDIGQGRKL